MNFVDAFKNMNPELRNAALDCLKKLLDDSIMVLDVGATSVQATDNLTLATRVDMTFIIPFEEEETFRKKVAPVGDFMDDYNKQMTDNTAPGG